MRRSLLSKLQLSLLALGLVGGGIMACGDDPAPAPGPVGDGDGDGDDSGDGDGDDSGDGDSGDGDSTECTSGKTKSCECEDGTSEGKLTCTVAGTWSSVCGGCPCEEGETEICMCGTKIGDKTCGADGEYGSCECDEAPATTAKCPTDTTCTMLPVVNVMACTAPGGIVASPPGCETNEDCVDQGFEAATKCSTNPIAAQSPIPGLIPAKICLQICKADSSEDPDAGT